MIPTTTRRSSEIHLDWATYCRTEHIRLNAQLSDPEMRPSVSMRQGMERQSAQYRLNARLALNEARHDRQQHGSRFSDHLLRVERALDATARSRTIVALCDACNARLR